MKTTFLILNFIFFAFQTFAQDNLFKNHILPRGNNVRNQDAQLRTEAAKVSLDSVISLGYGKQVNTYDANGYVTSLVYFNWDNKTSKWKLSSKNEIINDLNGNIISVNSYSWNDTISKWINSSKYDRVYDANGNQSLHTSFNWDKSISNWVGSSKIEYLYDSKNNKISEAQYNWNKLTNKWEGISKYTFTYDDYGNKTSSNSISWDTNTSQWSASLSSPITFSNTLNSNKKLLVSVESIFSSPYSKSEYTYDTYGNQILEVNYIWNSTFSQWDPAYKLEGLFDANGNRTMFAYFSWNSKTSTWEGTIKEVFGFDTSVLASSLATTESGEDFKNKITSALRYKWSNRNWAEDANIKFYYSNDPTGIEDLALIASQKNVVRIYNQLGIEVKPEQVMNGLYIYQYSDGSTRKVMRHE